MEKTQEQIRTEANYRTKLEYEKRMAFVLQNCKIPTEELMAMSKDQLVAKFGTGSYGYIRNKSVPKAEMVESLKKSMERDYRYLMNAEW